MFTYDGCTFLNKRELLHEYESRKARLHTKFGSNACNPTTDDDATWMWNLMGLHARGDKKITSRVKGFKVDEVRGWKRGTLHVILLDAHGREIPHPHKSTPVTCGKEGLVDCHFEPGVVHERRETLQAFRRLVCPQVERVRRDALARGEDVVDQHVGHGLEGTDAFGVIVVKYLHSRGVSGIAAVETKRSLSESGELELVDADLASGFQQYHATHAKMGMQDARVNMAQSAKDKRSMHAVETP